MKLQAENAAYVVNKDQTSGTGEEESTLKVSPPKARNQGRNDECHTEQKLQVPPMLELHDGVAGQITDVGDTRFAAGLEDHPAHVRPEQPVVRAVWVQVGVGVPVVRAVAPGPPFD